MARVAVADDVWADFRSAAGHRSVSEILGELVEREVARYRSQRLRDGRLEPRELVEALERARRQQDDLATLVKQLETLREPVA
jgi:predicted CopG family antitoxin